MADSGAGQFQEDAQYSDKFSSPSYGRSGAAERRGSERKRPGGQFSEERDLDQGFQKRGRYEEIPDEEPSVPPATLRVLVRQMDAGGIIGKGGENIKRLRKVHDCQVILPDSPGAPERVMTIMGRVEGCVGVLSDCLPKLGDGPIPQHGDPNVLTFEIQVLIPQPFMGTIIGTSGTKIKELRSKTQTSIKIFSEPMPNSNERSVQLIGTEDQIGQCVNYFLDEISKKEPREPIYLYEPAAEGDMYSGPPGGNFQPPPRDGPNNWRYGGRGSGFRGGGGRGGRGGGGGGDRGRGRGSWRGRDNRGHGGNSHQSPYNPPPPNPSPPIGGGSYNPPPPSHISSSAPSYGGGGGGGGGQANVGYSALPPQPPSGLPPPTSSSVGQVPPMYMPPSAPSSTLPPPASQLMPPSGQQTQQVTIPNEYAMSILGVSGGNLEHIKSHSSCDIVINDPKPGSSERIISITGSASNIQVAQSLMQNSVRQYHSI